MSITPAFIKMKLAEDGGRDNPMYMIKVSVAKGILIGNFAKVVGLKQNALFVWLRENGILIASGGRKNVPFQQYINAGYFTVKEVVLDDEDGYQIRLTPQLTGKGQQWLTRKLLDAGLLKPVAAE